MNINKKYVYGHVGILQREGFDIGCDSQLGGVCITNKSESKQLAPRGTPAYAEGVLRGFEAGVNAERQRIKNQTAFMNWVNTHKYLPEVAAFLSSIDYSL